MIGQDREQRFNRLLKISRNEYRRPKTILRFVVLVTLGGCLLNLLQGDDLGRRLALDSSKEPQEGDFPYSSLRKLNEALDFTKVRTLTEVLDNGDCKWVEPHQAEQDESFELFSTALVAFPGSAKRAAFLQLEGLTELLASDDYHLNDDLNSTRYAFYKTQYPHHEGVWSWGKQVQQTIYIIQNPRTALQTYMFLVHEINYSNNRWTSYLNIDNTFTHRPPISIWENWKLLRFYREMHSWSWHLEFWMEGGLFRDVFSHNITTPEHMAGLMNPSIFTEAELAKYQSEQATVDPTWDAHCASAGDHVSDMPDCRPVTMASYENIMDQVKGPTEIARLASVIKDKPGVDVIQESAWDCVWDLVVNKDVTGTLTDKDRAGPSRDSYKFTKLEIRVILDELYRLKNKYSDEMWYSNVPLAGVLVQYLDVYIEDNEAYLTNLKNSR